MIGWLLPMVSLNYPNVISRMKELFGDAIPNKPGLLGIGKGQLYPTVSASPYKSTWLSNRKRKEKLNEFMQILIDEFC